MIERYTLTSLDEIEAVIEALGGAPGAASLDGRPRFNIAPLQIATIGTADGLVAARWGLLPPWRGHGGKRDPHILHAPISSIDPTPRALASPIAQTPLLRNAFKSGRCLVIADGFFVWHRGGKKPQPLWIHPAPDPARPGARSRVAAFAGLTATHRDDGQPSFAIVVGPASPLVAPFAPTMPVVVPAEAQAAWLRGPRARAAELLAAAAAAIGPVGWRAEPVSTWVNSIEHDDERCIEPLGNPAQGELF